MSNSARNDSNFVLSDEKVSQFCLNIQSTLLQDDQHIAIKGRICLGGFHIFSDGKDIDS